LLCSSVFVNISVVLFHVSKLKYNFVFKVNHINYRLTSV